MGKKVIVFKDCPGICFNDF